MCSSKAAQRGCMEQSDATSHLFIFLSKSVTQPEVFTAYSLYVIILFLLQDVSVPAVHLCSRCWSATTHSIKKVQSVSHASKMHPRS